MAIDIRTVHLHTVSHCFKLGMGVQHQKACQDFIKASIPKGGAERTGRCARLHFPSAWPNFLRLFHTPPPPTQTPGPFKEALAHGDRCLTYSRAYCWSLLQALHGYSARECHPQQWCRAHCSACLPFLLSLNMSRALSLPPSPSPIFLLYQKKHRAVDTEPRRIAASCEHGHQRSGFILSHVASTFNSCETLHMTAAEPSVIHCT